MKSTKIDHAIQKALQQYLKYDPRIAILVHDVHTAGGRVLLVGGAVRDLLLGKPLKDLDIEVHGMPLADLERVLRKHGPVSLVGKAFGVLRVHGLDIDWSLPRTDTSGRKPEVTLDPHMSLEQAFRRRDLTINAMGIDLITYELIDPFGGQCDLEQGILRTPDPTFFVEDPLRLYRVMQFVGRFAMTPDDELNTLCASMDIRGVSVERIETEFEKLLLRSSRPSLGLRWLRTIGRLADIMPELAATIGVRQNPKWHPEGDVFEHSMQTVDASTTFTYDDQRTTCALRYAALCHDLGKVYTTQENEAGDITSYGHAQESATCAKNLLARITRNNELIETVCVLVKYHMSPIQLLEGGAKPAAYKRLARALAPHATLQMLADLSCADQRGRNPDGSTPLTTSCHELEQFIIKARDAFVLEAVEQPVLLGRDLLDVVPPGPRLGELLERAYEIQIEEGITDKQELRRRVLAKE